MQSATDKVKTAAAALDKQEAELQISRGIVTQQTMELSELRNQHVAEDIGAQGDGRTTAMSVARGDHNAMPVRSMGNGSIGNGSMVSDGSLLMPSEEGRARRLFYALDKDGSGAIEKQEVVAVHDTGPEMFADLDENRDGKVTQVEWMGFLGALEAQSGRKAVSFLLKRLESQGQINHSESDGKELAALKQELGDLEAQLQATESSSEAMTLQVRDLEAQLRNAGNVASKEEILIDLQVSVEEAAIQSAGLDSATLEVLQGRVADLERIVKAGEETLAARRAQVRVLRGKVTISTEKVESLEEALHGKEDEIEALQQRLADLEEGNGGNSANAKVAWELTKQVARHNTPSMTGPSHDCDKTPRMTVTGPWDARLCYTSLLYHPSHQPSCQTTRHPDATPAWLVNLSQSICMQMAHCLSCLRAAVAWWDHKSRVQWLEAEAPCVAASGRAGLVHIHPMRGAESTEAAVGCSHCWPEASVSRPGRSGGH